MTEPPGIEELSAAAARGNAGAQYNLGVCYLRGDGVEPDAALARKWIEQAADAGLAAAQSALGYMCLRAHGGEYDPQRAHALFTEAAQQGFAEGIYRCGESLATGLGCERDIKAARAHFTQAAHAGHPLAQRQFAYCLDQGIGGAADPLAATAQLSAAASAGEPAAAAAIAERYRRGHTVRPDPVEALAWFLRAGRYPGMAAAVTHLSEQLSPQQVDEARARAQREPGAVPTDDTCLAARPPLETEAVCEAPRVRLLHNLLSPEECWHLIAVAAPHLHPSQVLSSQSGTTVQTAGRSSGGMSITAPLRDVIVWNIEQRLAAIACLPLENGEPLSILRYGPGDEYRPHYDFFDPDIAGQATALERGGQRLVTILMYLCDVEAGGETVFPNAGVSVRPRPGDGVLFHNCTPGGDLDRASRHAGAPVRRGQKWLATKWVRERAWRQ